MAWGQDEEASAFICSEKLTTADQLPLEWGKCARKQITISFLEMVKHPLARRAPRWCYTDSSNTLGCYNKPLSFLLIHHLGHRCSLGGSQKGEKKMKNELLKFKASPHFSGYVWKTIFLIVRKDGNTMFHAGVQMNLNNISCKIILGCFIQIHFLSEGCCELCCAWLRYSVSRIDFVLASVTSALLVLRVPWEKAGTEKKHPAALYKIPTLHSIQQGCRLLLLLRRSR